MLNLKYVTLQILVLFTSLKTFSQTIQHGLGINVASNIAYLSDKNVIDSIGKLTPMLQYQIGIKNFQLIIGGAIYTGANQTESINGSEQTNFEQNNYAISAGLYYTKKFASNWFAAVGANATMYNLEFQKVYNSGVDKIIYYNLQNGNAIGPSMRIGYKINNKIALTYQYDFLFKQFNKETYHAYSAVPEEQFANTRSKQQFRDTRYPFTLHLNFFFNRAKN